MTLRVLAFLIAATLPVSAFAASGFGGSSVSAIYGGQNDVVSLVASTSLTQDNNLFRLAGNANPVKAIGNSNKSDTIATATVGVKIDKSYSLQRVSLEASVSKNRFGTFGFLDHDDNYYNAVWTWSLTPKLTGTLGATRQQTLNSFANVQTYVRNLHTDDSVYLNTDWWFASRWHALLGINETSSKDSAQTTLNISSRTSGADLGLKYESKAGNSVTGKIRNLRGIYLNQPLDPVNLIDNSFNQREMELDFSWLPTGKSSFSGSLIYMSRMHDHYPQRNLSGTTEKLNYTYTFDGKSSLGISATRSFSPYFAANNVYRDGNGNPVFTLNSSYVVQSDILIQPTWAVSPKASLLMSVDYGTRDYKGSIIANPGPQQRDISRSLLLGLNWAPTRYLSFSSSLQQSRRRSNNSTFEYDDIMASISAQLLLNGDF